MAQATVLKPDVEFVRKVKQAGGDSLKQCYQCATCSVVCNLSSQNHAFPRRQMILAQWGLRDALLSDPALWMCYQCNDCTTNCPREARPGDVFAGLRAFAFEHFAVPSFMGRALANRAALPVLFLVPILIMLGILLGSTGGDLGFLFQFRGEVDYAVPFPHGSIDALFVSGSLLVIIFVVISLRRFWKGLRAAHADKNGPGFIPALIATLQEIGLHEKFNDCEAAKPRYLGHLLIFYGFIGAFIATALNYLTTVILKAAGSPWYLTSPIDFPNVIKLFGIGGGIGLLVGGWLMIRQRSKGNDATGRSGYQDWLFLIVLTLVALTGMLAWILRITGIPILAYADYYVHLVLVFFLLLYSPYSKFGHIFYRTLALTYAKSAGIDRPRKKQRK